MTETFVFQGQVITYQFKMMSDQNLLATFYNMAFTGPGWHMAWQIRLCQIVFENEQTDNANFDQALELFLDDPEYYGLVFED